MANQRRLRSTARSALQQYGLADVALRLVGTVHNDVFRVTARPSGAQQARQFVLRLHMTGWLTEAQIESELMWLEAIRRDTSLRVPEPVRNQSGHLVTSACGTRTCTLFHWLDGRVLWKRPSPHWLHKIGRLMASLQDHGHHLKRPVAFERPRWDCAAMTGRAGMLAEGWDRLSKDAAVVLSDVCERFNDAAEAVGTGPDAFGLIHGDLHVANVLSVNGEVAAIDFDDCCDG
jgi:Ser/Thr protein kinase RdoA (MazF antagonist)